MIKNITSRKVRNRGFTPVRYRCAANRAVNGFVVKRGRKWMTFYSPSTGRKRIPLTEERYMEELGQ